MTDCPHEHQPDAGLQKFRDIVREETDGGRDLVRFFTNAMTDPAFMSKDEAWNYMYTVHGDTIKANTFASDGHDPFIYDPDLGRYVPADDKLRPFLADYMKHEWSPARVDLILTWYRDRSTRFWDPASHRPRQRTQWRLESRIRRAGTPLARLPIAHSDQRRMGPRGRNVPP